MDRVGEEGIDVSHVAIDPDSNIGIFQYQQIGMAKGAFIIGELTLQRDGCSLWKKQRYPCLKLTSSICPAFRSLF